MFDILRVKPNTETVLAAVRNNRGQIDWFAMVRRCGDKVVILDSYAGLSTYDTFDAAYAELAARRYGYQEQEDGWVGDSTHERDWPGCIRGSVEIQGDHHGY